MQTAIWVHSEEAQLLQLWLSYPALARATGSTGQKAGTSARAEIFSQENFRTGGSTGQRFGAG